MMKYSASGISTLGECGRKFFYRYYMKKITGDYGKDCDAVAPKAMFIGNVFHEAWETFKEKGDVPLEQLEKACSKEKHISINKATRTKTISTVINYCEQPAILKAMCVAYSEFLKQFTKKTGFEELCLELGFETELMRGYIDAVLYNKNSGKWAIQDKKTRVSVAAEGLANIKTTPQFLTYYLHLPEIMLLIEKRTGVKVKKEDFAGVYVCEITRPSKVRKKKRGVEKELVAEKKEASEHYDKVETITFNEDAYQETAEEFFERVVADKSIKVRQSFVSLSFQDAKKFWEEQLKPMLVVAKKMDDAFNKTGSAQGIPNTDNCVGRYGSPCDYWSQCHEGKTRSECVAEIEKNYETFNI